MEDSVWVESSYQISEIPDPDDFGKLKTKKCYDFYHVQMLSNRFGMLYYNCRIGSVNEGFDYDLEFFELQRQEKWPTILPRVLFQWTGMNIG